MNKNHPPRGLSPFSPENAGLKGVWKFCSQCRGPQVGQKGGVSFGLVLR